MNEPNTYHIANELVLAVFICIGYIWNIILQNKINKLVKGLNQGREE